MIVSCVPKVDKEGIQSSAPTLQVVVQKQVIAKKSPAILKLDTLGHTGTIKDIISVSIDKSIRDWDSRTGQEKRKILGVAFWESAKKFVLIF